MPRLATHAERVRDALRRLQQMPRPVAIALSGGTDSLAQAVLVARAGIDAIALHVHHGLHPSADAAADHAAGLAHALSLPFEALHVDGDAIRASARGIEAGARAARYEALASAAQGRIVLTAHTADDRLETVLLRMAQGCGATALAGPRRRLRIAGAEVRRPLLGLWRADTSTIVDGSGLAPWDDPMNADDRHLRVRVRTEVAPALRGLTSGGALLGTLAQLAEDARVLEDAVGAALAGALRRDATDRCELDRDALRAMNAPLRRAVLRAAILRVGARPARDAVADAARRVVTPGPAIVMGHRLRIEIAREAVCVAQVHNPRLPILSFS